MPRSGIPAGATAELVPGTTHESGRVIAAVFIGAARLIFRSPSRDFVFYSEPFRLLFLPPKTAEQAHEIPFSSSDHR